jgi:hypothetical protein
MDLKLFTQTGIFPGVDRKITTSLPNQSRSESAVAINPLNSANMIAISKKFIDPALYHFTVEPMVTNDGGFTWSPLPLPVQPGMDGFTDPVVAFDHLGTAFVVVMPLQFTTGLERFTVLGMQVFRLLNNGTAWSTGQSLIAGRGVDPSDDKPWMACDRGASSPFKGRIYAVWGTGSLLRVARSKDSGATWIGPGTLPVGAAVPWIGNPPTAFGAEVSVDDKGVVHVVWALGTNITYTRSTDGGETFDAPRTIVNGITPLAPPALPRTGSFPEFPHAKFRVLTLATGCAVGTRFLVAWSDIRDGFARIYYHYSDDAGVTWAASSGKPLWPTLSTTSAVQQFHPQIIADGQGVVACAFYEFGQDPAGYRIRTRIMGSFDQGTTFELPVDVTDGPWDPAINAPLARNADDTFIGEYFGLDGGPSGFAVVWTDTRTGVQELFYDYVSTSREDAPFWFTKGIVATLLGSGVASGGGGLVIVGGKIIKIPPRGPSYALLQAMVTLDAAEAIDHPSGKKIVKESVNAIVALAKQIAKEKQNG